MQPSSTIIIPAHDEADYIDACLCALLQQDGSAGKMRVIVAANACTDDTIQIARARTEAFMARQAELLVLDLKAPGKIGALNSAEAKLEPGIRIYLDADVICEPDLIGQLIAALQTDEPCYATGRLTIAPAQSWVTRAYGRLWQRLPFYQSGAVGAGLFATNAAGRARWGAFPDIISDDTFVRLCFAPSERVEVPARFHWPMIEGFAGLVKVRRRQDAGVAEVRALYPDLVDNEGAQQLTKPQIAKLALGTPLAFSVYAAVALAVKTKRPTKDWVRGR
ncbi:glycosyltransferase [Cognatiyoonia koreensis]|nr:glycosyltransferase [Cognatiyoonia koreensis]